MPMYGDRLSLAGRTALVAGAGAGMGFAIAQAAAGAGARVAVVDVDKERAEKAAARLAHAGAKGFAADVRDPAQVDRLINDVAAWSGGFKLLATVVGGQQGVAPWTPLKDMAPADWDRVVSLNLGHFFLLSRAAVNHFVQTGVKGSIVSISSVNGLVSAPNHGAYGAAKAGMISLTRTLAAECGHLGIRVNSVAPGAIMTERSAPGYPPATLKRLEDLIPLGRLGTVEDVAGTALFLLSDMAAYITGQTIIVDGGVSNQYPFGLQKAVDS